MKGKRGSLASFLFVDFKDVGNWIGLFLIVLLFGFSIWMFMK